ncbi:hypothetical protein [Alkalilimnicola ehrlichii]|uniref:hypothetical protein n=1 Tax=Alkalilimnicola ehrlichii TaxID=351052 RepID=UPI001C6E69AE|nr:hypothetical protein [Alkalilimnicola ehrlichii]
MQLSVSGDRVALTFAFADGDLCEFNAPSCAACLLETVEIDTHCVERYLESTLLEELPRNVTSIRIRLRTEAIDGAYYHYSHGLKKHQGQCQRIAHGHRSRLLIERDGVRAPELEQEWAERWRDIYIGSREDVVADELHGGQRYLRFRYQAAEGEFELLLARKRCYLIDTDSTVEHIAAHLASELGRAQPQARFLVRAFEGVGKGALAHNVAL